MGFGFALKIPTQVWSLQKLEGGADLIVGQFHAEELTTGTQGTWAEHVTLGRQHPIASFLHGNTEAVSFRARFYQMNALEDIDDKIAKLRTWARKDSKLGRPPILTFKIGAGRFSVLENDCYVESVTGIKFHKPTITGKLRHVEFTVNLKEYVPPDVEDGIFETRYHRAKEGEYYEILCAREYGNPNLGDVIRKRHADQPLVQTGDVVKLPSIEALRKETLEQTSIALAGAYDKRDTPQRRNRLDMFERRSGAHVSHIVKD